MDRDPFEEYLRQGEPAQRDLGYAWQTAVGLQAVDDLQPSQYLIDTAKRNIEGEISLDSANALINSYLHISGALSKQDIDPTKQDIGAAKQDIQCRFPYADVLQAAGCSPKTISHAQSLFQAFDHSQVFGRGDTIRRLGLSPSAASALLKKLLDCGAIEAVVGMGKGKYKFSATHTDQQATD